MTSWQNRPPQIKKTIEILFFPEIYRGLISNYKYHSVIINTSLVYKSPVKSNIFKCSIQGLLLYRDTLNFNVEEIKSMNRQDFLRNQAKYAKACNRG